MENMELVYSYLEEVICPEMKTLSKKQLPSIIDMLVNRATWQSDQSGAKTRLRGFLVHDY